jgi:type IV secretory pathway VirB2 component (pilin)
MERYIPIALYVAAMIAVIVGADLLFFRNHFWARLIANIGIVLVFGAFYLRFMRALF